jgi:hypothetical protein
MGPLAREKVEIGLRKLAELFSASILGRNVPVGEVALAA